MTALIGSHVRGELVAGDSFEYEIGTLQGKTGGTGWTEDGWKTPPGATQYACDERLTFSLGEGIELGRGRSVAIHGTGTRNNPLRRQLNEPYAGDELYVRFLINYDADSIDDAGPHGDGEFVMLWLDDIDGGDGANHNHNVPNIGITVRHPSGVPDGKNYFVVRIGSDNTAFTNIELEGDRTYFLVACLSKTKPGPLATYDRLELWVDPEPDALQRGPDAVAHGRSFNSVRWVGFSTGQRTEPGDLIFVDELALGKTWDSVVPRGLRPAVVEQDDADASDSSKTDVELVSFRQHIYPLLREHCFDCHQGYDADAAYRLDLRDEILGHYQGKPLAIPGDSQSSPLVQVLVTDDESERMPLGGDPLTEQEIALLRTWIDQGLDWDENLLPAAQPESDHWAFQPVRRPAATKQASVVDEGSFIDTFISAKHQELGLHPAPPADRRALLRRAYLVLTGLPPTREEISEFLADESPDAYRKVVDRLLASPHYGERWGRYWLDLVRWAESDGYQHNEPRPHAWRYRDYVIRSFAENKPYDQFVREQLSGDEMEPYSDENIVATGMLAAGRYSGNELDKTIQRNEILVDITNNTASALLGLTLQCAQCHTHKFDPITARDYYRFMGFFVQGQPGTLLLREDAPEERYQEALESVDSQYRLLEIARSRIEGRRRMEGQPVFALTREIVGAMSPEQRERYKAIGELIGEFEQAWGYYSPVTSPNRVAFPYHAVTSPLPYSASLLARTKPVLLVRGEVETPGPEVDVGWPAVFGPVPHDGRVNERPRTVLSDWLFDRGNPLTSRVWVNRIWQHYFGRGIVTTPDDLGTQGALPTHPELLDWLAAELIDSGWDTGHVHRLILNSNTFRQSHEYSEVSAEIDPENQYYWRWTPRRMEAEDIRDAMLAVSGLLDRTIGGLSVPLKERDRSTRRTLYLEQKRGELPFVQQLFDAPPALTCAGQRRVSTVALQPLYLLNNPDMYRYAQTFAQRTFKDADFDQRQAALLAFESALGRSPTEREEQILWEFLDTPSDDAELVAEPSPSDDSETPEQRFVQLCHGLLNLNEFLYVP